MKPAPFTYHAPESIADACAVLAEYGEEAKVLAGGQSLVPMLALRLARFDHLVDVNRVRELSDVSQSDDALVVGAMVRQRMMERDPSVGAAVPLLARATPLIGHFQIRNRGTVGGSLAHADPASEYPAVALALGATFELVSTRGRRRVDARDFFVGTWTTSAEPDELLVSITFPARTGGFAIEEIARRHGDFALAGVVCAVDGNEAAIALFGVGATAVRAHDAEAALAAHAPAGEVADVAVRDLDPSDDVHASGATRRKIARHLVERAVVRAREEAAGAAR